MQTKDLKLWLGLRLFVGLWVGLCCVGIQAQEGADVEALYEQFEQETPPVLNEGGVAPVVGDTQAEGIKSTGVPGRVTELAAPGSFKDIIVLQRRFLPKTKRLEFSALGQMDLDNTFAVNMGASVKVAGYFLESHGIELHYDRMFRVLERPVGKALHDMKVGIIHYSPRQSFGAAYKWQPFYGKMAWFDKKIIPFDLYFTLGWMMATREQDKVCVNTGGRCDASTTSEAVSYKERQKIHALSFGMGQLLAFGKSWGLRWDLAHNRSLVASCTIPNKKLHMAIKQGSTKCGGSKTFGTAGWTLSVGMSYFFPKAKYR